MSNYYWVFLMVSIVGLASVTAETKIYGGQTAADGQFPFTVSIKLKGNHHCGGTILNEEWILTAGHCMFRKNTTDMTVLAGTNKLNEGGTEFTINSSYVNDRYDNYNIANDVAVIKLNQKIKFTPKMQPIPLSSTYIPAGELLTLSAWGYNNYSEIVPNDLQFINLKSIAYEDCKERLDPQEIYESELCTLNKEGEGACYGDSGSPLIFNGTVAGIVSWGRPCAHGWPDVFTRVYSFNWWITSYIQR